MRGLVIHEMFAKKTSIYELALQGFEVETGESMKMARREFVELLGASAVSLSVGNWGRAAGSAGAPEAIELGGWRLSVAPSGDIISLTDGKVELVNRKLGDNHPRVLMLGKALYECNQPQSARRDGAKLIFHYAFAERHTFTLDYELELIDLHDQTAALKQNVKINAPETIREAVKLVLPRNIQLPWEGRQVFIPLKNGVGRRKPITGLDNEDDYLFQFAGTYESGKPQRLAIPLLDEYADESDLHLTLCADPYFTSHITLPYQDKIGLVHCIYLPDVGVKAEERTVYTGMHRGDARTAMRVFYSTALADVPAGPDWLHPVAMIDYDYLSKNGRGWYADIDKLTEVIKPADRSQVFLALHAWYDLVGHYTYDHSTHSLAKQWMALPSARDKAVQALGDAPEAWNDWYWHKRALENLQPVPMSIAEVHRRIRYARDRGFRVGLYYADGLSSCDRGRELADPTTVLHWGGWHGPDTLGKTYQQSPLHPGVRDFYKGYLQALINEYGREVDGFIMDETFFVDPGDLGTEAYPGYADRAMMTLVKELAAIVAASSRQLAFFASDVIGVRTWTHKAPYALMAHATYQDSGSRPEAWPYGLFPNFRNTLWSCNWAPVSNFRYTKYAVETFDTPVTISNGCAGDDMGISEVSPPVLQAMLDLFAKRKTRRMDIGWIEENHGNPTYQGREILYRNSLWSE